MTEGLIYGLYYVYGYIMLISILFVSSEDTYSWDVAIANEEGIKFFYLNGTMIEFSVNETGEINDFYMVTYDYLNEEILLSVREYDVDIFAFNFTGKRLTPLVTKQKNDVLGITCDPVSRSLFWTDGNGHTIWKRGLYNESSLGQALLTFKADIPAGIGISICKRLLFWTNINHLSASISRSHLDGSNHEKIILEDIFVPLAITVDDISQKLYWTDDESGIYFKIESSDFDGTNRKTVVQGTNQEPIGIVSINNAIYWTDTIMKNVWTFSVDTDNISEPKLFYKFIGSTPYGIAAYRKSSFDCSAAISTPKTLVLSGQSLTKDKSEWSFCLNGGVQHGKGCRCKKGFSGLRCELSSCHNFCLNSGRCFPDDSGHPKCRCPEGFSGDRCQVEECHEYCLNGGRCFINNSVPTCKCGNKHSGERCDISLDFTCRRTCASYFDNVLCGCNTTSYTGEGRADVAGNSSLCDQRRVFTLALLWLEGFTMLVVVILARKVCLLRHRPRIKKRIIINKGVKSHTPMTARPQVATSEQCEITIENCCNMNICETPCFESSLRSPRNTSSKLLSKKTEDKKKLLINMEGEFESSDVFY